MASSATGDIAITTSDWKQHQSHQHGSAVEYPQESNVMRRIIIRSYNDAPEPIIKMGKPINPYADPDKERRIFRGKTYDEINRRFKNQKLSNPDDNNSFPDNGHLINFQPFPESETGNTVFLPQISTKNNFDEWLKCLIDQMEDAGLERYIPKEDNNWSPELMIDSQLSEAIIYMWKKCVPQEHCPEWVELTPYNQVDPSTIVLDLLDRYHQGYNKQLVWREAAKQINPSWIPKNIRDAWAEGMKVYRNFYSSKQYEDIIEVKECLQRMTIESYATISNEVRVRLDRKEKIDLKTALNLMLMESKLPTKTKSTYNREVDKVRRPYEHNKKSTIKTSNSWSRAQNGTNRTQKTARNYNKHMPTKRKGKVNYIEQSSNTNNDFDDVSAGTDSCFLSSD
ncbi:Transposon Ty2-LR1 Gag-Pol polyprotein [Kluyveromyces marxianus]